MSTRDTIIPKLRKLYLCRYGWNGGVQVCLYLGEQSDGYLVQKWRSNSGRWTQPVAIRKTDIVAKAVRSDLLKHRVTQMPQA
jgi:hypothetical protein